MVIVLAMLYALLIGFLCYVALKPVWRVLDLKWRIMFAPLALFWFVDVLVRCTICAIVFQSVPTRATLTVTELCNSLALDVTYKGRWARGICRMLNVIQPSHCSHI